MSLYKIPKSIKVTFDIKDLPELSNRIFRIIWVSISVGHLRDQYFNGKVSKAVRLIKKHAPKNFEDFQHIIYRADLNCYGTMGHYQIDQKWWQQVWDLISGDGDIELVKVD